MVMSSCFHQREKCSFIDIVIFCAQVKQILPTWLFTNVIDINYDWSYPSVLGLSKNCHCWHLSLFNGLESHMWTATSIIVSSIYGEEKVMLFYNLGATNQKCLSALQYSLFSFLSTGCAFKSWVVFYLILYKHEKVYLIYGILIFTRNQKILT